MQLLQGSDDPCFELADVVAVANGEKTDLDAELLEICSSEGFSETCTDFMKGALAADPEKRTSARDLCGHAFIVQHPHFSEQQRQNTFTKSSSDLSGFASQTAVRRMFASAGAPDVKSYDLTRLQKEFEKLDPTNTGEVPADDLRRLLEKTSPELSSKDLDDIVAVVDEDNSGTISYTEFVAAAIGQQLSSQKDVLASVFKTFDINEDGTVSRAEIAEMLQFQDVVKIADIDKIMASMDLETKDEVTFDEFCELVRRS
jgi:hypothetical protein